MIQPPIEQPASPKRLIYAHTSFRIKVHCGCGFSADSTADGIAHTRESGHTCCIAGEIRPVQ